MMKLLRHNRLWALAATLFASSAWGDIVVRFDTPDVTVGLGDEFTMDIVADIPDPVLGWGLDLSIVDPTILSTVGAPAVGPDWFGAFAPDGDGLAALAFPNSVSGNGVLLATMTFSADALGETDLLFSITAGDLSEGFPLDIVGFGTISFEPGHVTVIPAPGAVLLGIIGMGMIALGKRRSGGSKA